MNKYFGIFLIFSIIFGMFGIVFGGTSAPPQKDLNLNQVNVKPDGSKIITVNSIKYTLVKATATNEYIYQFNDNKYYDQIGSRVSERGYYVNSDGEEYNSKNEPVSQIDFISNFNRRNTCIKNPNSCDINEISTVLIKKNYGKQINWKPLFKSLGAASKKLTQCQQKIPKKCSKLESDLNNINEKINLNTDVSSILNSMTAEQQKIYTKNYNKDHSCNIGFGLDSVCNWMTRLNANELALVSYKQKIANYQQSTEVAAYRQNIRNARVELSKIKSSCSAKNNCNSADIKTAQKNLDTAEKEYIKIFNKYQIKAALSGLDKTTIDKFGCKTDPNACLKAVKGSEFCKKELNKEHCSQISGALNSAKDSKLVQTNTFYDIMNALANPDQNAIYAAKLFGFEPNYDNVPKLLKTSVASQICAAKINGYLDKTETNSGGGITSYGCDSKQTQNFDPNTGLYVNIEPNCKKVLLDFRAQRAQITPNNKVAITYSLYLKAPPKTNINYFLAVKYLLKDGSTKKQLLKPNQNFSYTGIGGVVKEFDTIYVSLNVSKSLVKDTKSSFSLGILARYPDGSYYQFYTIPAVLITATDFYSGISAGNGGGSNSNGGTGSSNAALTPAGMLNMI